MADIFMPPLNVNTKSFSFNFLAILYKVLIYDTKSPEYVHSCKHSDKFSVVWINERNSETRVPVGFTHC